MKSKANEMLDHACMVFEATQILNDYGIKAIRNMTEKEVKNLTRYDPALFVALCIKIYEKQKQSH